jgi:hypothetical protein
MSNNLAEADPLTQTSEETYSLAALPGNEAPASVPATSTQDTPTTEAAIQPDLDVEALDEAGYYQQIANIEAALANAPQKADATQSQAEEPSQQEVSEESAVDPETEVNPDIPLEDARLPERIRIGNWNEIERKAVLLRQRNPDMTLAEALARVSPQSQQDTITETTPEPVFPSEQEITSRLAELKSARADAFKNVELDKIPELDEQIEEAKDQIGNLRVQQAQQQAQDAARFETTVSTSKTRAVELYPDVTKAESPLVQKMIEIDARLKDSENPLYYSADKPLKVAQMAANELGIPPRDPRQKTSSPKATTSARTPAAPANGRPTTPPIAPANARTSRPSQAVVNGSFDDLLSKAESMDDLIAIASKLGR